MAISEKDITLCGHGSGTPSLKNLEEYNTSRYSQKSKTNNKNKGVVAVVRLKALTDEGREKFREKITIAIGRNIYNQMLRDWCYKKYSDGRFYSDCSSIICYTFKEIGYGVPSFNTAGMYNSSMFEKVPVKIVNGHITNPEILKVGDCIFYIGDDPSRPLQIGHVEAVYSICNTKKIEAVGSKGLVCTTDSLNIRSSHTTSSSVKGSLTKGQSCNPFEYVEVNGVGWFHFDKGWVSGKYLKGWIRVDGGKWMYLKGGNSYAYYSRVVVLIDGQWYAFGEKYMLTSKDISSSGAIIQ